MVDGRRLIKVLDTRDTDDKPTPFISCHSNLLTASAASRCRAGFEIFCDSMESMLLTETLPVLAQELQQLLQAKNQLELAAQVTALKIVEGCGCGDDFCASFYTQPKPKGAYGTGHYTLVLEPADGMLILDVVGGVISFVEVLYRPEIREKVLAAFP